MEWISMVMRMCARVISLPFKTKRLVEHYG